MFIVPLFFGGCIFESNQVLHFPQQPFADFPALVISLIVLHQIQQYVTLPFEMSRMDTRPLSYFYFILFFKGSYVLFFFFLLILVFQQKSFSFSFVVVALNIMLLIYNCFDQCH